MADEDFKIEIDVNVAKALAALRQLSTAATKAQQAIAVAFDAAGRQAGTGGLSRFISATETSTTKVKNLSAELSELIGKFTNLSRSAQNALRRDAARLPTRLGQIELFQNAGQVVPNAILRDTERTLIALRDGLRAAGASTRDLGDVQRQLRSVQLVRSEQDKAAALAAEAKAADRATAAQQRLEQAQLRGLQTRARNQDTKIAAALSVDQPNVAKSQALLNQGIQLQTELAQRGFRQAATMANIYREALQRLEPEEDREVVALRRQIAALDQAIERRRLLGQAATGAQLTQGVQLGNAFVSRAQTLGNSQLIDEATQAQGRFATQLEASRLRLDSFNKQFTQHTLRIAEGLVIYNAFGAALGQVRDGIELVAQKDVELKRFSLVAGELNPDQLDNFANRLGQIAVSTNTDFSSLIATSDQVTASFANMGLTSEEVIKSVGDFQEIAGQFSNVLGTAGQNQEEVTGRLVALFRQVQATGGGLSEFRKLLDQIVVAGEHSSTVIDQTSQALAELAPAANAAGVNLDFAATLLSEVIRSTGRSGTEIGNLISTTFIKLRDVDVVKKAFDEVGLGIVKIRDEAGKLKPAQEILEDFVDAVQQGRLSPAIATNILQQLGPPLNPAALGINTQVLQGAIAARQRTATGGDVASAAGDLEETSRKLLDTLGGRIGQLLQRFKVIVGIGFAKPLTDSLTSLLGVLNRIADVLQNKTVQGFISNITKVAALAAAMFLLNNVVRRGIDLFNVFKFALEQSAHAAAARINNVPQTLPALPSSSTSGAGGLPSNAVQAGSNAIVQAEGAVITSANNATAAQKGLADATKNVGTELDNTAALANNAGNKFSFANFRAGALAGAITAIGTAARLATPLILTFIATQGISKTFEAADLQETIRQAGPVFGGRTVQGLKTVSAPGVIGAVDIIPGGDTEMTRFDETSTQVLKLVDVLATLHEPAKEASDAMKNQFQNATLLRDRLSQLAGAHELTADKAKVLADAVLNADGTFKTQIISSSQLDEALSDLAASTEKTGKANKNARPDVDGTTAAFDAQAAAAARATVALEANANLLDERTASFAKLADALQAGNLTQEEFSEKFNNVNNSADLAARAVAVLGETVAARIPGVAEIMQRTGDSVDEALFKMFSHSPEAISNIEQLVSAAEQMQEQIDQIRENAAKEAITPVANLAPLATSAVVSRRIMTNYVEGASLTNRVLAANPVTPRANLTPILQQLVILTEKVFPAFLANPIVNAIQNSVIGGGGTSSTGNDDLDKLIDEQRQFNGQLAKLIAGIQGAPTQADETAKQQNQTPIIDIGDLPESRIRDIIQIAREAQAKVVAAGGKVDTDEIAAIFKGTEFEKLVRGIDQRFLQKAIEELTNVEKKRLELEQQRLQDVTRNLVTRVGPIQSLVSAPVLAAGGGVLSGSGLNADPRLGNFTINVPINWSGMSLKDLQRFIVRAISRAFIDAGRGG